MLAVTLAAAPAAEVRVALPGLTAVGVDPKLSDFYGEHLAQQMSDLLSHLRYTPR